jgi:hypothetical protein
VRVSSKEASDQMSVLGSIEHPSASLSSSDRKRSLNLRNPLLWFATFTPFPSPNAMSSAGAQGRTVRSIRFSLLDRLFLKILAVLGVVTLIALLVSPHFFMPAEDTIILFQYSRNLAKTGAITYLTHGLHA